MDIWHWWLAKLIVAQILYLVAFITGMRALKQWRFSRIRVSRPVPARSVQMFPMGSPTPFRKP